MKRHVVTFLAAGALLLVTLLAVLTFTARPAAADNCNQLVNSITDLSDPSKVEDCLRTGGNWGRVIGTVVGGAGVAIAGLGLLGPNRPALQPPPPSASSTHLPNDPCARLPARGHRIHELDTARKKLEADILNEFHSLADKARSYTNMYRDLQTAWYQARQCLRAARIINSIAWQAAVVGLLASMKAFYGVATLQASTLVVADEATAMWVGMRAEWALAAAKTQALKEATLGAMTFLAGVGKDFVGELTPSNVPSVKPWHDPTAEEIRQALIDQLRPVATRYAEAATEFNRVVQQWGANRQQDLDRILAEIRAEAARWNADAAACPEAKDLPQPAGSDAPPMVLQLPQVMTTFDEPWFAGGSWDPF